MHVREERKICKPKAATVTEFRQRLKAVRVFMAQPAVVATSDLFKNSNVVQMLTGPDRRASLGVAFDVSKLPDTLAQGDVLVQAFAADWAQDAKDLSTIFLGWMVPGNWFLVKGDILKPEHRLVNWN